MEPKIPDEWWCLFHADLVGTRQNYIVLVEDRNRIGTERYTLKKYRSHKVYSPDATWRQEDIWLDPLNPDYPSIRLDPDGVYCIRGRYVGCVSEIKRVEDHRFRDVPEV